MALTLRKITNGNPLFNPLLRRRSEVQGNRVDRYLRQWEGPLTTQTRYDLARNNLNGLSSLFHLMVNDPTPGQ